MHGRRVKKKQEEPTMACTIFQNSHQQSRINNFNLDVVEPLVDLLSTSLYSAFDSSVVAVGRSGGFAPNIGANGCPKSFSGGV